MCRGTNTGGKTAGVKEIRVSGKCAKGEGSLLKVLTDRRQQLHFSKSWLTCLVLRHLEPDKSHHGADLWNSPFKSQTKAYFLLWGTIWPCQYCITIRIYKIPLEMVSEKSSLKSDIKIFLRL